MMVHEDGEDSLTDFFVAAGGADGVERKAELIPIPVYFDETAADLQLRRGLLRCARQPGRPRARPAALRLDPAGAAGRARHRARPQGRAPDRRARSTSTRSSTRSWSRRLNARRCTRPRAGGWSRGTPFATRRCRTPSSASPRMGAEPFYRGDIGPARSATGSASAGGTLGMDDMAAYEPIERRAGEARFRGYDVLTNPPPSSGGILIAYSLGVLERLGRSQRRGADRRRHGGGERAAHRRLPRGPARRGLRASASSPRTSTRSRSGSAPATGSAAMAGPAVPSRTSSARPPTSPCSTPRATAPRSPARTGPAPGSSSPAPGCTSTTCWGRRTSTRRASTGSRPAAG